MIVDFLEYGIKTKLKLCPFCGSNGVIQHLENGQYYPICSRDNHKNIGFCLLSREPNLENDGFIHLEDAIEVWNKRARKRKLVR